MLIRNDNEPPSDSPAREMYLGTHRSKRRREELEVMWNSCVNDL